jgi:hypothetical protein
LHGSISFWSRLCRLRPCGSFGAPECA